jgi:hypothetical protein
MTILWESQTIKSFLMSRLGRLMMCSILKTKARSLKGKALTNKFKMKIKLMINNYLKGTTPFSMMIIYHLKNFHLAKSTKLILKFSTERVKSGSFRFVTLVCRKLKTKSRTMNLSQWFVLKLNKKCPFNLNNKSSQFKSLLHLKIGEIFIR